MPKRRVAHIVRQAGGLHDAGYLIEMIRAIRIPLSKLLRHSAAKASAYSGHLQRMRQTVVNKDTPRKRENLRFVLQTAEWSGKDDTIIVALEIRTKIALFVVQMLQSEAFIGYKLGPIHHILRNLLQSYGKIW